MPKRLRPGVSATSILRHVEEIVLATSGEDAFEMVFSVAAAEAFGKKAELRDRIRSVSARFPMLEVDLLEEANDELLKNVADLLARTSKEKGSLDAVFESLVPRISKAEKGQFFTPRHVVDFVIKMMLAPSSREVVVDPACGSGAFLTHARWHAKKVRTHGCDVDPRAIRVARLLALVDGVDPSTVERGDGLRLTTLPQADIVATNPPFAGRAASEGFEIAKHVRTPERDVLFLGRALSLLRPGGRLGIVLPYNKASGEAFASMRRWFVDQARIFAIVGLPRETFLPHTSQRTFVMFAAKRDGKPNSRMKNAAAREDEPMMLMISERAGKDTGGEPIFRKTATATEDVPELDHDLDDVGRELAPFLQREGFLLS
jgi:type I restriction enzyme M protein